VTYLFAGDREPKMTHLNTCTFESVPTILIKENEQIFIIAINCYIMNQTSRDNLDFHKAYSLTTADKAPHQFSNQNGRLIQFIHFPKKDISLHQILVDTGKEGTIHKPITS
jgi:hypothetical protein